MKYFNRGPGADPYFEHRFHVKVVTEEMFDWCKNYPLDGPFERWHIEWHATRKNRTNDVIQFESDKAAYMFKIAFSEYILRDDSINKTTI